MKNPLSRNLGAILYGPNRKPQDTTKAASDYGRFNPVIEEQFSELIVAWLNGTKPGRRKSLHPLVLELVDGINLETGDSNVDHQRLLIAIADDFGARLPEDLAVEDLVWLAVFVGAAHKAINNEILGYGRTAGAMYQMNKVQFSLLLDKVGGISAALGLRASGEELETINMHPEVAAWLKQVRPNLTDSLDALVGLAQISRNYPQA